MTQIPSVANGSTRGAAAGEEAEAGRRLAAAWFARLADDAPGPSRSGHRPVNDLAALPAPGVLVLDDYHLVCAPAVHAAVAILLEHLPPALHLVAASREDPPLPLPRLCARRQLVEVRAAELGFSVEEAATLLGAGMGAPGRGAGGGAGRLVDRVGADVLRLLAARRCNAGIAAELVVEQSTVKSHLSHVYSALGLHSRTQAWPARRGCWADIGRGFHPASPPSGGRPPPATPPS